MNLTLKKLGACTVEETINKFILSEHTNKYQYSNWLLSKILSKENRIRYAIFAAELVINIFETKYPGDKRPRNAIETAKKYLNNQTDENKNAAAYAANAANAAAYAADAADAAGINKKEEVYGKIIEYGLLLLSQQDKE